MKKAIVDVNKEDEEFFTKVMKTLGFYFEFGNGGEEYPENEDENEK